MSVLRLIIVAAFLLGGPVASADTLDDWPARLAEADRGDWRTAFRVGHELASTAPPDEAYAVLARAWPDLGVKTRQQLLKAFYYTLPFPLDPRMHPRILDVLHLGVIDQPEVQAWAHEFLQGIAFRDFAADPDAYDAWYAANRERPIREAREEACRQYLTALIAGEAEPGTLSAVANVFRSAPDLCRIAKDAGLVEAVLEWLDDDGAPPAALPAGLAVLASLQLEPRHVDALLEHMTTMVRVNPVDRGALWALARTLGMIGEPRSIPTMIAVIDADDTYDTIYGIGHFGLGPLTGVEYDETHDGAWWRQWWAENRQRFAPAVRDLPLPELPPVARAADGERPRGGEADILVDDRRAGGDDQMRYFLIGPRPDEPAPADGFRLLLVLPGGDGSAEFHPFVTRIFDQAVPEGYLVAQLVAPQWSADQFDTVVWPNRGLGWKDARFVTEQFVAAVVADVRRTHAVDAARIRTLSWSSGGPAAYAAALDPACGITGSLVAMSVFKPDQLPPLERAKGQRFYVLHSPQDFIPMRFPIAARDQLARHGATTTLVEYQGGHGWHGDVFGHIRRGLAWLDE